MLDWYRIWVLFCNLDALNTLDRKVIKFLWNECPIRIYRTREDGMGTYWWDGSLFRPLHITIGKFRSKKTLYTALLHEVGHYRDHMIVGQRFKKNGDKQCEKAAWKWALRFSDKYEIPINAEIAQLWLLTYKAKYRCLDNRVERDEMGTRKTGNRL